jgi:hypothetical protein
MTDLTVNTPAIEWPSENPGGFYVPKVSAEAWAIARVAVSPSGYYSADGQFYETRSWEELCRYYAAAIASEKALMKVKTR